MEDKVTRVYGTSDDMIEVEGEVMGEVGCYGTDERERGVLLVCSDGTMLEVKYGKYGRAIWEVKCLERGPLLDRIEICTKEDGPVYSDLAYFRNGLKWVYAAKDGWERVR